MMEEVKTSIADVLRGGEVQMPPNVLRWLKRGGTGVMTFLSRNAQSVLHFLEMY